MMTGTEEWRTDLAERGQAVDLREHEVEEDQVGGAFPGRGDGCFAVCSQ